MYIDMVTAETITEEQIRELRRETMKRYLAGDPAAYERMQVQSAALAVDGGIVGPASYWAQRISREEARARCAEIWNARVRGDAA